MTFLVVVEMAITDSLDDVAARRAAGTTGGHFSVVNELKLRKR